MLVEMVFGKLCPSCSRWTLRRLARHRRYYRCSACGGRFKWFNWAPGLMRPAPRTARSRNRTEAGTWKGFAAPKDLGATTSGRLLQSKRTRDLPGGPKHQPHPPTRQQRLDEAEREGPRCANDSLFEGMIGLPVLCPSHSSPEPALSRFSSGGTVLYRVGTAFDRLDGHDKRPGGSADAGVSKF